MAGALLLSEARKHHAAVLPVDSEHSAVWQCLEGKPSGAVAKLVLTSSGGPFRNWKGSLAGIKPAQALKHPKWKMGPKITVDSATLMNKGLEVIEAANLFGVSCERVDVLIHPEAIVHGMIEFVDGSYLAHLGVTDMRLPIQYALTWPGRLVNHLPTLDFAALRTLSFEKPSFKRFPCLTLGYEASRLGGTMPAVLNAANEVFVEQFLNHEIGFLGIPKGIEKIMAAHRLVKKPSLKQILEADHWAREEAKAC
jgi:1-deoxy-D-xylulose-5-phosphate reductoisomerase